MEILLEFFLYFGAEFLLVLADDRIWPDRKVPRTLRALVLYAPLSSILGLLSSLLVPAPAGTNSLNPWVSLVAVPCLVSIVVAQGCRWLEARGILQTELRHFSVSAVAAFVFAASRYVCLKG